jgi:hypothetical protein
MTAVSPMRTSAASDADGKRARRSGNWPGVRRGPHRNLLDLASGTSQCKRRGCHPKGTQSCWKPVCDALAPLGVRDLAMPATPERLWRAIRAATR